MTAPTQQGRKFRVETPLGPDVLLLERFTGEEAISAPYAFTLHMVSTDPHVDPAALLRQPVCVAMELQDGSERVIHGRVRRFVQLDASEGGKFYNYRAEVVPWLWFLSLSSDCRIFQEQSTLEIIEAVFRGLGYDDFDVRCHGSYAPREYCVQYRETHLAFVSRLMEEEGIFYFFEHADDKHTLVLADSPGEVQPCPGQATARLAEQAGPWQHEDVVLGVAAERRAHTGKVAVTDYNYLTPSASLLGASAGESEEEHYDFPGKHLTLEEGDRLARLELEAREAAGDVLTGESTCRAFLPGFRFTLAEHYRGDLNREYQLLRVAHRGGSGGFGTDRGAGEDYRNEFTCIPHAVPYRPPRATPRPIIHGTQTAVVVGPAGEEIFTDKHGRVKVQFFWDRLGKKDEASSCWMRVSTPWAGKGWGGLAIPRIGQEVVVDFIEGDPDRPLITGRVYNAEQTPPYDPASGGVVSGMRSKTHKGAGYNEMSMNDTAGKEMITIHAQFDMSTTVEHDQTDTVNNNRTTTIAVDDTESVGSNQKVDVGANQTETVGADQSLSVGANQTIDVGSNRTLSVGSNEETTVGSNRTTSVGANDELTVGSNLAISAGADVTADAGANASFTAGAKMVLDAGTEITITAGAKITLSAGGSTIEIGPSGITLQTGAIVQVQGATIKLN